MIAPSRRLPVHDFLLVAFAVTVISISQWPESGRRQWVQLRQSDGTLRQFSLPENDPRLAKLSLSLEKWARAGQETRLAIARWRAELAEFYAGRTAETSDHETSDHGDFSTTRPGGPSTIRAVSFRGDSTQETTNVAEAEHQRRLEHAFWLKQAEAARQAVAEIEEVRRSRRALEVPPPIVFGRLAPAGKPSHAILFAALIGVAAALAFAGWAYLFPALGWSEKTGKSKSPYSVLTRDDSRQLELVVPADWIRLRQPPGVRLRQAAVPLLVLAAITSILI